MRILDPSFEYVPSHKTNIAETFKRVGFVPPSERFQAGWQAIEQHIDRTEKRFMNIDFNDPVIRALIELETKQ